jgi:hypothetical protein
MIQILSLFALPSPEAVEIVLMIREQLDYFRDEEQNNQHASIEERGSISADIAREAADEEGPHIDDDGAEDLEEPCEQELGPEGLEKGDPHGAKPMMMWVLIPWQLGSEQIVHALGRIAGRQRRNIPDLQRLLAARDEKRSQPCEGSLAEDASGSKSAVGDATRAVRDAILIW